MIDEEGKLIDGLTAMIVPDRLVAAHRSRFPLATVEADGLPAYGIQICVGRVWQAPDGSVDKTGLHIITLSLLDAATLFRRLRGVIPETAVRVSAEMEGL